MNRRIAFSMLFAVAILFAAPFMAHAQGTLIYTQGSVNDQRGYLGGIVPCDGPDCQLCNLVDLGQNIINFSVYFGVALAVVMFAYAGILYVSASAGGTDQIKKAHGIFTNVLIGLVIVLGAWIFIDTIMKTLVGQSDKAGNPWNRIQCLKQPDLIQPNTNGVGTGPSTQTGSQPTTGTGNQPTAPSNGNLTDAEARSRLLAAGVGITSSGNCSDQGNSSCTSLEGIPASTVDRIIALKNQCGSCSLTITGGTETGHQTHGTGDPVVDLHYDQATAEYLKAHRSELGITAICTAPGDSQYSYNCSYPESSRQLHVQF